MASSGGFGATPCCIATSGGRLSALAILYMWFSCGGRHLAVNLLHILNTLDLEGVVLGAGACSRLAEGEVQVAVGFKTGSAWLPKMGEGA